MRYLLGLLIILHSFASVRAQTVVFSDDFMSPTLDPGWAWFGSPPGYGGGGLIFKESLDQSNPAPPPGTPPMLFHPVPYSASGAYSISCGVQLAGPGAGSAMAYGSLAWVDLVTGAYTPVGSSLNSFTVIPQWEVASSPTSGVGGAGPAGSQFGVMFTLDPQAVNAWLTLSYVSVTHYVPVPLLLDLKLWLDGAYDQGTGLMRDDLRAAGLIPLSEPNSALFGGASGETVAPSVLAVTGPNAVVDWIRIELRGFPNGGTARSCNALLQRDGDVVATDGLAPITFNVPAGNYYVVARHRNHLGVMTASALPLTTTPTTVDFRSPSTTLYTLPAPNTDVPAKSIGNQRLLWAGNAVVDDRVKYTGSGNDRDAILQAIGGSVPTNTLSNQYRREDTNLDGVVKYTGAGNDRDVILQSIGGSLPTAVRIQQVP